ncbi:MAG: hypothetical protein M1570_17875 [Chloroflexi bacterium]|nr:hypothetical protein [Chloroflexota bacterium]
MKPRLLVGILLSVMVLILSAGQGQAQGPQPAGPNAITATTGWLVNAIDSTNDVGKYASIAFAGNTPYISYYDATNKVLRVAKQVSSDGNCGPGNTWYCQTVDNGGGSADVGQYSSIAVSPSGTVGIAYYDATNHALKFVRLACVGLICLWANTTVFKSSGGYAGMFASLKYDSAGVAHIAFQAVTIGGSVLLHAYSVASGGTNCGDGASSGKWQCDWVDSNPSLADMFVSLDVDADDTPWISYYSATNKDLKMAHEVSSGGNCGNPIGGWSCLTIDSAGDVGQYSSIAFKSSFLTSEQVIAYYDATNRALKFADRHCYPLCAPPTISTIASNPTGTNGRYASVRLDSNGMAHVAYWRTSIGPFANYLEHAYQVPSGGNCGTDAATGKWQCDTIDTGSGIGQYASLAFNGTRPYIAYYDGGNKDLKLAFLQAQLFLPLVVK